MNHHNTDEYSKQINTYAKRININKIPKKLEHILGGNKIFKQSYTGMDRPLGLLFEAPNISRQSAHEGGQVVSPVLWLPSSSSRHSS
jgi:hypothetical protein